MSWDIDIAGLNENYTHNTNGMIVAAGIQNWPYGFLQSVDTAAEMIEPLKMVLENFAKDPEKYRAMNPENGWGDFDQLQDLLSKILKQCIETPEATVFYFF